MGKYRSHRHVGRVRSRLSEILRAQGYTVAPEDLRPQVGAWRTDHRLDVCRWEAQLVDSKGISRSVQCWDTMSDCVRYGVVVEPDSFYPTISLNVYANRPGRAVAAPAAVEVDDG